MTTILFIGMAILAILGHGYFWVAIVNRFHGFDNSRKIIDGGTLACLFFFLTAPLLLLWYGKEIYANWHQGWNQSAGLTVRYFQFCAIWCVGEFTAKAFFSQQKNPASVLVQLSRFPIDTSQLSGRELFHGSRARLLSRIPGNQACQLMVERKRIVVPRLPPGLIGLKIAHVSDFHLTGRIDKAWFEMVVAEVNRLQPDVIVITGDIVEHTDCFAWLKDTICQLQAPLGVYFILGNHDHYVDVTQTQKILTQAGFICLSGRSLETNWHEESVLLAANERPWFSDVPQLKGSGAQGDPFRLFLLHSPDQLAWARKHQADLILAGHTHGGQICFPLLGAVACPSKFGTRYTDGVYQKGSSVMHVTRGVSGRMPLRWLCPPEIALLELEAEAGTAKPVA